MISQIDPSLIRRLADLNAVYRMFDAKGTLLYIGMTGHARRFDEHGVKRWFPAVATITLEWHDTEASARVAEKRAIQAERPRYNIAETPKGKRSKIPADRRSQGDVLGDVLRVLGDAPGQHWDELARRLGERWPERWGDLTYQVLSAHCRARGVRSVGVSVGGRKSKGCRRADVEQAAGSAVVAQLRVAGDLRFARDGHLPRN